MASTTNEVGGDAPTVDAAQVAVRSRNYWSTVIERLRGDPVTLTFGVLLLLIVLSAVFANFVAPYDPASANMIKRLKGIGTAGHLLGTDETGRDMLSRLLYGGRLSLFMGVVPVINALIIGGTLGIFAGFVGGLPSMLIMRAMDVFYAFPSVLLAIAISGALGAGIENAVISLTVVFIPPIARISESVTT
ncbi:MAG: peptide/nickel transport system permease protein, partial [Hyphomicrobiaceae bacterium]